MNFWRVSGHRFWLPNMEPVFGLSLRGRKMISACGLLLVPFWRAIFGALLQISVLEAWFRQCCSVTRVFVMMVSSQPVRGSKIKFNL